MSWLRDLFSGRFSTVGPLLLRVVTGIHLIHGSQDNVFSWARMIEFRDFLAQHGFPLPLACAVVSVLAQFVAGFLFTLGYRTRAAAAVMVINFLVAIFGVHIAHGHPYPATFPALFMLAASLSLLFTGPGALALENRKHVRTKV
jgi:Predicted membrane protein